MKNIRLREVTEAQSRFLSVHRDDLFWNIFHCVHVGIALTDANGNLLLTNAQFVNLIQQSANKINFKKLLQSQPNTISEIDPTHLFSTGQGTLRISWAQFKSDPTDTTYLWQVSQDAEITHKNKMSELRRLYRSFVDNTFEWVFRTDTTGKILFSNKLFAKSMGYPNSKDLNGTFIQSLINPTDFNTVFNELTSGGRLSFHKIKFKKNDGTPLTGLSNLSAFEDSVQGKVFNWTVLDVSKQTESEQALKTNNEELEKVNYQMEKFLYSTSHDLRSPITSILGILNLIRMESQEAILVDYISKIEISTLKLDKIIRDIMTFSQTTYQRASSEKVDLEAIIWKTLASHKNDPSMRNIYSEVTVTGGFPFYNDSLRLAIIFENIIRNSVQFYDSNKTRSFIQIHVTIEKTRALLEIIDNGIGIGKQHLESIFNMFYKATHLSKGAGLGLFIVKQTLEKMNGTVEAESEIGFGTVVKVVIPNDHKGLLIGRKLDLQSKS